MRWWMAAPETPQILATSRKGSLALGAINSNICSSSWSKLWCPIVIKLMIQVLSDCEITFFLSIGNCFDAFFLVFAFIVFSRERSARSCPMIGSVSGKDVRHLRPGWRTSRAGVFFCRCKFLPVGNYSYICMYLFAQAYLWITVV